MTALQKQSSENARKSPMKKTSSEETARFWYDYSQHEYDVAQRRTALLETKAGILVAILAFLTFIAAQLIDTLHWTISLAVFTFNFAGVVSVAIGIWWRKFAFFKPIPDDLGYDKNCHELYDEFGKKRRKQLEHNIRVNNRKVMFLKFAMAMLLLSSGALLLGLIQWAYHMA